MRACADDVEVRVSRATFGENGEKDRNRGPNRNNALAAKKGTCQIPRSGVLYRAKPGEECQPRLFVSETELDRDMSQLVRWKKAKLATVPKSVRKVQPTTFRDTALQSVVLSEGLEKLEHGTFKGCKTLKSVWLQQGLTCIEDYCFCDTGLERIVLPKTLQQLGYYVFSGCKNFSVIYVEDGFEGALTRFQVPDSMQVGPLPETRVRGSRVWDLRQARNLVLPDDIELMGSCWFWGCKIESVRIPASVKEIASHAFCSCKCVGRVIFAPGSKLEKIGRGSFC